MWICFSYGWIESSVLASTFKICKISYSVSCVIFSILRYVNSFVIVDPLGNDFLYVCDWSHHNIYQVSLLNGTVRALKSAFIEKPSAVAFDVFQKHVLWADSSLGVFHWINIDGSGYKFLFHTGMIL